MPEHVCPWWVGYLLASPLRKLIQDPHKLLASFVKEGMTIVEPGPGMGFFTLELARLAGSRGRVIAIDIQPKMLRALDRRARKAGLGDRIELRQATDESMAVADLTERTDFVLAIAVVHELPDAAHFFEEMHRSLKTGGLMLLAEPPGHVKQAAWEETLHQATIAGFRKHQDLKLRRFRGVVLIKP
jgi:ubiquinone/menaquinone biosynthesis C-methylase UbiE